MKGRLFYLLCVLAGLSLAFGIWSFLRCERARIGAVRAADDESGCRSHARAIRQLRRQPMSAGSRELEVADLARRIEQAGQQAQMTAEQLVRVSPEASRRLGDTVYKEKPTQLLLHKVTLRQLTVFLHNLCTDESGLHVRNLRLSAPRDQEQGDQWVVEATLSYFLYAPPDSPRK